MVRRGAAGSPPTRIFLRRSRFLLAHDPTRALGAGDDVLRERRRRRQLGSAHPRRQEPSCADRRPAGPGAAGDGRRLSGGASDRRPARRSLREPLDDGGSRSRPVSGASPTHREPRRHRTLALPSAPGRVQRSARRVDERERARRRTLLPSFDHVVLACALEFGRGGGRGARQRGDVVRRRRHGARRGRVGCLDPRGGRGRPPARVHVCPGRRAGGGLRSTPPRAARPRRAGVLRSARRGRDRRLERRVPPRLARGRPGRGRARLRGVRARDDGGTAIGWSSTWAPAWCSARRAPSRPPGSARRCSSMRHLPRSWASPWWGWGSRTSSPCCSDRLERSVAQPRARLSRRSRRPDMSAFFLGHR